VEHQDLAAESLRRLIGPKPTRSAGARAGDITGIAECSSEQREMSDSSELRWPPLSGKWCNGVVPASLQAWLQVAMGSRSSDLGPETMEAIMSVRTFDCTFMTVVNGLF
jgi:hypothetical protein